MKAAHCIVHPEILRTCKRIYNEGCQIPYGMSTFSIPCDHLQQVSGKFLCMIVSANRSLMKKLVVQDVPLRKERVSLANTNKHNSELTRLFKDYTELRHQELVYIWTSWQWSLKELAFAEFDGLENTWKSLAGWKLEVNRRRAAATACLTLGTAASIQGSIPELQHVCQLRSRGTRRMFFSRVPLGTRNEDVAKYWLPSDKRSLSQDLRVD